MMTKKLKHSKYSWLRTVSVLSIAVGMLMLFGFTQLDPQVITAKSETKDTDAPSKSDIQKQTEISIQTDSTNGLHIRGVKSDSPPFVWISGSNPHELPYNELSSIDPKSIESFSILKDGSYPDEIKVAIGDRKFDQVIVIEPKGDGEIGEVLTVEYTPDEKTTVKSSKWSNNVVIWLVNEKQEIKQDQMNKIDPDTIESISVLKKSPYPDEVSEAMGDRQFGGVILIKTKK